MAWIGAEIHGHSPGNMRIRYSAIAIVSAFTAPRRLRSRPLLIERTASQSKAEGLTSPPSGGWTTTCQGIARRVEVMGMTTTSPALLTETTWIR